MLYTSDGNAYETKFDQIAATLEQTKEGYPYYQVAEQSSTPEPTLFGQQYAMMKKGHPVTDPVSSDPLGTEIERQAGGLGRGGSNPPIDYVQRLRDQRRNLNERFDTAIESLRPTGRIRTVEELSLSEQNLYNMYENLRGVAERFNNRSEMQRYTQQRDRILREGWFLGDIAVIPKTTPKVPLDKTSLILKEDTNRDFTNSRYFRLYSDTNQVGHIELTEKNNGRSLYVNYVEAFGVGGPNALGKGAIRSLMHQIKETFPDAEKIYGWRISGARQRARDEGGKSHSMFQTIRLRKPKEGLEELPNEPQFFMPESGKGNWPWSQVDSDTSSTFTSLGTTMQEASAQAQDLPVDRILQSYKINPKAWEDWLANSPMSENIEDRREEKGQDAIGDLIRGILNNDKPQFAMQRPTLSDPLTTEIDKQAAGMTAKGGNRTQYQKGNPYWTDERISKALELREQGKTLKQVADELGGTVGSLSSALTRRGLNPTSRPEWTTGKVRRAKEMFEEGWTQKEISAEVGLSVESVRAKIKEHGWSRPENVKQIPDIPESTRDKFNRLILEEWRKLIAKERPDG